MSNIDVRVMRARFLLVRLHAFFGSLAMRLAIEEVAEAPNFRTMATDGRFLYYCKAFLDRVSEEVLLFTVAHEVLHCALGHHVRRGHRDHERWNIACDYVVNWLLYKAGFKVPEWAYLDPRFDGMTAETVYRILEAEEKAKQKKQEQQRECDDPPMPDVNYDCDPIADQRMDASDFEKEDNDNEEEDDQCESDGQDGQGSNDPSSLAPDSNSDSDQDDGSSATTPEQNACPDAGPSSDPSPEDEPQSGSSDGTSTPSKSGSQSGGSSRTSAATPVDAAKFSTQRHRTKKRSSPRRLTSGKSILAKLSTSPASKGLGTYPAPTKRCSRP